MERKLPLDIFLSYQKSISPHRYFHNISTFCKWFSGDKKMEENNNITWNSSRSNILTLLKLLSADAKSAVLLTEGSVINQNWSTQFPGVTFPQMALFGSLTTFYVSATVKTLVICKCQCHYFIRYINSTSNRFN